MMVVLLVLALVLGAYLKGRKDGANAMRGTVRESLWGKEKK